MVDGVVLLVDASARARCRRPGSCSARRSRPSCPVILVVNKVDRPDARIEEVVAGVDRPAPRPGLRPARGRPGPRPRLDPRRPGRLRRRARPAARRSTSPPTAALPDNENLEPLFATILEHIPAPTYDRGRAAAGARHQPRRLAVPRPPRAAARLQRHAPQGPDRRLGARRRLAAERQDHRAARDQGARPRPDRVRRPGRHRRRRRHRGHHDRRDAHRRRTTRARCR